jgi:hypothetical protein
MPTPITPERLAGATEHSQQTALFCWRAIELREGRMPELRWLHAIPNGGQRSASQAVSLSAEGTLRGIPDIFLPVPRWEADIQGLHLEGKHWHGLYIEMKKPGRTASKQGHLTPEQFEFSLHAKAHGYQFVICYHWYEAVAVIKKYLGYPLDNASGVV